MWMEFLRTRRWPRLVVVLLLATVLSACGSDDGDDEPTATSEAEGAQPTVFVEDAATPESTPVGESAESSPTNTDMSNVPAGAIDDGGVATPAIAGDPPGMATPSAADDAVIPVASPAAEEGATPIAGSVSSTPSTTKTDESEGDAIVGDPVVGDGTTGASLESVGEATPAVSASPVASPAGATPAAQTTVTGCEVANVPAFMGEQTTYAITTDVMFRVGPGTDCDLAIDAPLGEFQQVVVIGGPVTREDDGSDWVQLNVNGTEGWVSFEFLQPVS